MHATTVILHGDLGRRFGRTHRVFLDTGMPTELLSYFRNQFRGFAAYMLQSKDRGVGYQVFNGQRQLDPNNLAMPFGDTVVRIAPRILGAKNGGVFSIILGAVLVVAGGFISGWTLGAGAGVGGLMMEMGISMILGGAVQLLTPVPKGITAKDSPANQPSYSFNGPVNTQAQGNPVPLLIGRMIVGSAVISAGITTQDTMYVPTTSGAGTMGAAGGVVNPFNVPIPE